MFDIEFKYIEVLLLLVLVVLFGYIVLSKKDTQVEGVFRKDILKKLSFAQDGILPKTRTIYLLVSLSFMIIALAQPYIKGKPIKVESNFVDVVVVFDISHSMFVDDIYPNRFEFAKRKFTQFLDGFQDANMGIIGFSSRAFLVSPMTHDYNSLKFLISNLSFDYISLKGTSILSALESVNMLYNNDSKKKKAALFFTDGGDNSDLSKEIAYAKEHNIAVFIYAVATKKGGVIKLKDGVAKDKKGNIIISRLNENIKQLALQTGGAYMNFSLQKGDIKQLANAIKQKFKVGKNKEETIIDNKELFFIPLGFALLFYFMALFSIPTKRVKR